MNKRQKAALQLNITLENQTLQKKKLEKREQLRNGKKHRVVAPHKAHLAGRLLSRSDL